MSSWPVLNGQLFLATEYLRTASGTIAGGACDVSADRARARARSEAVERASLMERGPCLVVDRQDALRRGLELRAPYEHLLEATDWVPARTGTGNGTADAAVPADLALLGRVSVRPLAWKQSSVGTAAHPDREAAARTGLLECLERYAVREVWSGRVGLAEATDTLRSVAPAGVLAALAENRLVVHAWLVRDLAPVRVALVLLGRADRAQATFGACARLDDGSALMHALCEAVSVRAALAGRAAQTDRRFARAARSAGFQDAFLAYLRALERADTAPGEPLRTEELAAFVADRFGTPPVWVDVPPVDAPPTDAPPAEAAHAVVKAVIPAAEFVIPRDFAEYIIAPGYLE